MRKTALVPSSIGVAVLALGLTLAGCSSTPSASSPSADTMSSSSPTPSASPMDHMSKTGTFMGLNGKSVKGTVTVSGSELTLTGFSSDEGPDLHVYLTNGTDEAAVAAGKQIDPVAFDKDSQSFMLNGVDASMYKDVVIHCDKAKAVFGAAALS
ncbi:DM13 domain-containing protein [Microbacterium azadirachtae]|uniref:Electron transfer DM13 n=1 Tax=Microbacterium azadirachtae TaxID=582680 RepID=A0A0F0KY34_9MICO|nr:DM13 domain-containing protein [Microbacterium azadirachtae]KJL25807.1 Electron transfer DM13 [Microbacterium azadirachtae]UXW85614.1 DM13 domain-containing protein [Microbacterium azadirachtae]SDM20540.1 Electron transfer DM13 [Microbacterium azadirachtae]SEG42736.1 Electron transfer DM13 [Microbacterium azadirachtae]SEG45868.1 Electron transfer DM13 [Microbacterium azadirachtae]